MLLGYNILSQTQLCLGSNSWIPQKNICIPIIPSTTQSSINIPNHTSDTADRDMIEAVSADIETLYCDKQSEADQIPKKQLLDLLQAFPGVFNPKFLAGNLKVPPVRLEFNCDINQL